jgi:hypothetical protein
MSDHDTANVDCSDACAAEPEQPPSDFVELIEFRSMPIDRKLGY